ncbi:hypothetical protein ACNKHK_21765 [Shigella flexneri]
MVLKSLRKIWHPLPIDVHLMVKPVNGLVPTRRRRCQHHTFHPEASEHVNHAPADQRAWL